MDSMIGELRMVGLFTSKIANESARLIPIVRRKLDSITRWEDLFAGSHDHKAVVALFDSFPKDELFTAPAQELRHVIMTLLGMAEGREVRLFVLHDEARRSVFAIVALPPDHVSAGLARSARTSPGGAIRGHLGGAPHRDRVRIQLGSISQSTCPRAICPTSISPLWSRRWRRPRAAGTIACPTRWSAFMEPRAAISSRPGTRRSSPTTTRARPRSTRRCSTSPSSSSWVTIARTWWRFRTSATWPSR